MRFDAVLVIGLPESGRGLHPSVEFMGIPIVRVRGFNANRLHLRADERTAAQSPGQVGAYLAHAAALRLLEHLPYNFVLVVEDDAVLADDFSELVENLDVGDAEMVQFHGSQDAECRAVAFAYGITKSGAARLVEFLEDRRGHVDVAMSAAVRASALRTWFLSDRFVLQRQLSSLTSPVPNGHIYSQHGEQAVILDWLSKNMPKGFTGRFLEIGAADGVTRSNCRALAERGWEGVCVEPNPYLFCELHRVYRDTPRVHTVCALVWPWSEIRTLHLNQDGLSTSDASVFHGVQQMGVQFHGVCRAPTVTPAMLSGFGSFEFVSIDAEGADLAIVQSGKEMLRQTELLCVEKYSPPREAADQQRKAMLEACAEHGFKTLIAETDANLILAKKPCP